MTRPLELAELSTFVVALPILGTVAGLVGAGTWLYGVADAFVTGRKK